MKKVLVPLADGAEEMETVIIVDILRRAGFDVTLAGITGQSAVICSRNMRIIPDTGLENIDPSSFDAIVLPGGKGGTERLMADIRILTMLRDFSSSNRLIAAVCAAPLALQAAGIIDGKRITCHPSVKNSFTTARCQDDNVVIDGQIVTSRGAGTTLEFALTLVKLLKDGETAARIAREIVSHQGPSPH